MVSFHGDKYDPNGLYYFEDEDMYLCNMFDYTNFIPPVLPNLPK
jgi:hypothetical protein